jgi:iron(III) transport system substrate-binding protein
MKFRRPLAAIGILAAGLMAGCGGSGSSSDNRSLTIYSGREEEIVQPLFETFEKQTGITLDVRWGKSAELAAQIAEEGDNSPADVIFSQDAGALGSVASKLSALPQTTLDRVPATFRDGDGRWIGTSGRVRVVVYNTKAASGAALPDDVLAYSAPKYASRMGIAPTNASFQAFVSAMRITHGDARTKTWLTDLKNNGVKTFESNRQIVEAVAAGEIDYGLVNHYYLALVKAEQPDAPIANKFLAAGDPGALVNVAGVGILATTERAKDAQTFVDFLLSDEGQRFYSTEAEENEYPLVAGFDPAPGLPKLSELVGESFPLTRLADEEKTTLEMIDEVGFTV